MRRSSSPGHLHEAEGKKAKPSLYLTFSLVAWRGNRRASRKIARKAAVGWDRFLNSVTGHGSNLSGRTAHGSHLSRHACPTRTELGKFRDGTIYKTQSSMDRLGAGLLLRHVSASRTSFLRRRHRSALRRAPGVEPA